MDNTILVAISYRIDENSDVVSDLTLRKPFFLADLVVELSSGHVVNDEDNAILFLVDLVDVDDAGVVKEDKHVDLVAGFNEERLVYFGGEGLSGVSADAFSDC